MTTNSNLETADPYSPIPNSRVPTFSWPGPHLGVATFFCWEFNFLWSLQKSFFGADLQVRGLVFSFLCLPLQKSRASLRAVKEALGFPRSFQLAIALTCLLSFSLARATWFHDPLISCFFMICNTWYITLADAFHSHCYIIPVSHQWKL